MAKFFWKCGFLSVMLAFNILIVQGSEMESIREADRTIGGIVKDTDDLPVIGAAVIQANTANGVVADEDGSFSLTLEKGKINSISISCIGYKIQTIARPSDKPEIVLEM